MKSPASLLALSLLVAAALPAREVHEGERPIVLSGAEGPARNPAVSASEGALAAAWIAEFDGRERVFARLRSADRWSPLRSSTVAGGIPGEAAIACGEDSAVVAWTVDRPAGSSFLCSVLTPDGLSPPRLVSQAPEELRMQSPVIALGSGCETIAAWTSGAAGRFSVSYARRASATTPFLVFPLTQGPDACDLFPSVSGGASPRVYWFSLGDEEFRLRGVDVSARGWRTFDLGATANAIPAQRLPIVLGSSATNAPAAVWLEPGANGDTLWHFDPRIDEAPRRIPPAISDSQGSPDAVRDAVSSKCVLAWSESLAAGPVLAVEREGELIEWERLDHPVQPRLASQGDRVAVIYVSDAAEGGTGKVYLVGGHFRR